MLVAGGGTARAHAAGVSIQPVCGAVPAGYARCFSFVKATVPFVTAPSGYGPADLQSAYPLPSSSGGAAKSRSSTPSTTDRRVRPRQLPVVLRAAAVHDGERLLLAVCPNCHILLVEATTNLDSDLYTAEDTAAALGANAISNSWGGDEYSGQTADDAHFNHPGAAITVSSGDSGYAVEYPAASRYVTAVGGTSLNRGGGTRGWSETAWSGAGSGCSAYETKPSWQTNSGCSRRTVADVSAVADPNTGVAVLYASQWWTVGGTSASSPIIAGVYALAGNASSVTNGSYPYSHTSSLFDVVGGSNGTCSPGYLCTGVAGYDGPTGLGTPNGSGGF